MTVDLDKLRAALDAATQGEWRTIVDDFDEELHVTTEGRLDDRKVPIAEVPTGFDEPMETEQQANAAYIVAVQPRVVRELIAEVERLREAVTTAEAALGSLACEAWPKSEVYLHGSRFPARLIAEGHFQSLLRAERETSAALAGDRHDD